MQNAENLKKGFTLTELLVCLAILVVLSAISIPIVIGLVDKANDKEDTLMAKMYTNCVVRFANEVPQPIDSYTNLLSADKNIASNAGKGNYPGFEYWNAPTEAESIEGIRTAASIAFKMYGENTNVKNNYTIDAPLNDKNDFIYYFMSGKVVVKSVEDAQSETASNLSSGNADALENYWVCLNKPNVGSNPGLLAPAPSIPAETYHDIYINLYNEHDQSPLRISACQELSQIRIADEAGNVYDPIQKNGNTLVFKHHSVGKYFILLDESDEFIPINPIETFYLQEEKTVSVLDGGNFYGCSSSKPFSLYVKKKANGEIVFAENHTEFLGAFRNVSGGYVEELTERTLEKAPPTDLSVVFKDSRNNKITYRLAEGSNSINLSSYGHYLPEGTYTMSYMATNFITTTETNVIVTSEGFVTSTGTKSTVKKYVTPKDSTISLSAAVDSFGVDGHFKLVFSKTGGKVVVPFSECAKDTITTTNIRTIQLTPSNISLFSATSFSKLHGPCKVYVCCDSRGDTYMGEIYITQNIKTDISMSLFGW